MSDYAAAVRQLDKTGKINGPDRAREHTPESLKVWAPRRSFSVVSWAGVETIHHGTLTLDDVIAFEARAFADPLQSPEELIIFEGPTAVARIRWAVGSTVPTVLRLDGERPEPHVPDEVAEKARALFAAVLANVEGEQDGKDEEDLDWLAKEMTAAEDAFLMAMSKAKLNAVVLDTKLFYSLACMSHDLESGPLRSCGIMAIDQVAGLG